VINSEKAVARADERKRSKGYRRRPSRLIIHMLLPKE
jgi:hypothetical protein